MGIFDIFTGGGRDPQRKLMRMPLRELREKRIEVDMQLKSAFRQIEKLRAEYAELIERGTASVSDNEQRLLASDAKKVREKIALHQRDFDGLKDIGENFDSLIAIREGVGDNTQRMEKELQGLVGMSQYEFNQALHQKSADFEKSRIRVKERASTLTDYGSSGVSPEEDSPELAMMRSVREPSLAKPAKESAKQADTTAETKKNTEIQEE